MANGVVKVTVNLPEEAVEFLKREATLRGATVTSVLTEAIGNEQFFSERVAEGAKVLLLDPDNSMREVLLPSRRRLRSTK